MNIINTIVCYKPEWFPFAPSEIMKKWFTNLNRRDKKKLANDIMFFQSRETQSRAECRNAAMDGDWSGLYGLLQQGRDKEWGGSHF